MKFTEEHKRKISEALKGHSLSEKTKRVFKKNAFKKGMVPWNKGKKNPSSQTGENHWNWRGGRTSEVKKRTNDPQWKILAKSIYERDNWSCKRCHKHIHKTPQCHHKIPVKMGGKDDPKNLITLCASCHIYVERHLFDFWRIPSYDLI